MYCNRESCILFILITKFCLCHLTRKYKPLHMQSTTFPSLCYSGRFSPFDITPPRFENPTEEGESKTRFVQLC